MDANFFAKLLEWIADFVAKIIELIQALGVELGILTTEAE